MAQVKLTKNELKKQKDALKRFRRYLPTLQLKKQQLQMVLRNIEQKQALIQEKLRHLREDMKEWVSIFADRQDIPAWLSLKAVHLSTTNIAGTDIPTFEDLEFELADYDFFLFRCGWTQLWRL